MCDTYKTCPRAPCSVVQVTQDGSAYHRDLKERYSKTYENKKKYKARKNIELKKV